MPRSHSDLCLRWKLKRKTEKISRRSTHSFSDSHNFKSLIAMTTISKTLENNFVFVNNFSHLYDSIKKSRALKLFANANLFDFIKRFTSFSTQHRNWRKPESCCGNSSTFFIHYCSQRFIWHVSSVINEGNKHSSVQYIFRFE